MKCESVLLEFVLIWILTASLMKIIISLPIKIEKLRLRTKSV